MTSLRLPCPSKSWVSIVFALLFLGACASGDMNKLTQDDAGPALDANTKLPFGDECTENSDCQSGLCLDDGSSSASFCSSACTDGCPAGFACGANDACVHAANFQCKSCAIDSDCGGEGNRCIVYDGGSFCAADCANDTGSCPTSFSCQAVNSEQSSQGQVCVSDTGVCCIDEDGDFRGIGDDCRATDCDDSDPDIYDDSEEVCDGKDNDCTGGVDVGVTDCEQESCRLGSNSYVMRAAESCMSGSCAESVDVSCGLYSCIDGADSGDSCAIACDGEDDVKCTNLAHCDNSACEADLSDAGSCDEDGDCQSGHCQNDFCCAFGDCCTIAEDCPSFGSFDPVCENPTTCQGARGAAVCTENSICATTGTQQDDSACTSITVANDCGLYVPIFCNGNVSQTAPVCPSSCQSNADCDANAYCDDVTDTCLADEDDGQGCNDDSQCGSGHCRNSFCCTSGDCCESASDCPAQYSSSPQCSVESACQGQRDLAECINFECSTFNNAPDDSACTTGTLSSDCGAYPAVTCNGGIDQTTPVCATSCGSDSACDANAYCNAAGQCELDEGDGSACTGDSQCVGGHCENGFCCASGDCCANSNDCGHLDVASTCDSQTSCQGTRVDGVCGATFQCSAQSVNDDSACSGLSSDDCGPYLGVSCSNGTDQASNQAGLCATTCNGDGDCDTSAHCTGGACVPDAGPGGFCNIQSECGSGLTCVDSVCCGSACAGECEACDITGSVGTCTLVGDGQDPDAECGAVDCSGYYFGWQGDICFEKASLSAAGATCDGTGSCASTVEECTNQTVRGNAQVTCDTTCQSPDLASCVGTSAGNCTNLDLGTETCGTGVCEVTQDRCDTGQVQSCSPNTAAMVAESCDGLDNDCNGSTDDGLPQDSYEANNSCASHYYLGLLGENLSQTYSDMTIYTAGDEDWYRQLTTEAFDGCTAGVDEEYRYEVIVTPPAGKDYDLQLCYNSFSDSSCSTDCFDSTAGGDQAETIALTWSGPCGGGTDDGLNFFIRVYPYLSANSCEAYTLQTSFNKTN